MPASRPPKPLQRARKPITQRSPLVSKNKKSKKKPRNRRPKSTQKKGPRIACLSVPLFPLAARLRCEPELLTEGVAVFEGNGHLARVVAATRRARKAGVQIGMTLNQARARMPKLVARARDTEGERTAQDVLLEIADRFTPRVEDAEPGCVYLDLSGLERRWQRSNNQPNQPEVELGREILRQIEDAGLPARIGIASSKLAARVAAGLPRRAREQIAQAVGIVVGNEGPAVVPTGDEADFLAPLPLHRLSPESEIAETLERWGIEKIGDFAKLPKAEVASRLGETGRRLHATARGIDPRPLTARQQTPTFREGMTLEWPIINLEPFLFIARSALERLCQRLEARGLGCKRIEMSLNLEPDGYHERSIELPSPTREVKTLITLLRLDLEAHTPGAPVTAFSLLAHPDTPKLAQLSLLGPASLSPDRLATTLARLFALLGPGRVGSPRTEDGHLPERFRLVEYTPPPPPKVRPKLEPGHGLLSVRVLRPPISLEVITDSEQEAHKERPALAAVNTIKAVKGSNKTAKNQADTVAESIRTYEASRAAQKAVPNAVPQTPKTVGLDRQPGLFRRTNQEQPRPLELRSEILDDGEKTIQIQGAVRIASGPWELEERWWREDRTRRDYWDIELSDGSLYRIFREREKNQWFADGVYD